MQITLIRDTDTNGNFYVPFSLDYDEVSDTFPSSGLGRPLQDDGKNQGQKSRMHR